MGKKLYVGNLPFSATDQSLVDAFSQCGTVESAKIITDRDTGRSKGFAFITFATQSAAEINPITSPTTDAPSAAEASLTTMITPPNPISIAANDRRSGLSPLANQR